MGVFHVGCENTEQPRNEQTVYKPWARKVIAYLLCQGKLPTTGKINSWNTEHVKALDSETQLSRFLPKRLLEKMSRKTCVFKIKQKKKVAEEKAQQLRALEASYQRPYQIAHNCL